MNKQEKDAVAALYPEETRFKSDNELKSSPSKKQPRFSLRVGDIVEFPSMELFKVAVVDTKIGEQTFPVESIGAFVKSESGYNRAMRFPVTWLSSEGYSVFWVGDETDAKEYEDSKKEPQPIDGHTTAHQGSAVTTWQGCVTQLDCKMKFAGKKVKVESIVEYVVGQFDKRPKPIFKLTLLTR